MKRIDVCLLALEFLHLLMNFAVFNYSGEILLIGKYLCDISLRLQTCNVHISDLHVVCLCFDLSLGQMDGSY